MSDAAFFVLRRSHGDPMKGQSTADVDASSAESGPPMRVNTIVEAFYGVEHMPPADVYASMELLGLDDAPMLLASAVLFERLEKAAPGSVTGTPVELLDTHQKVHPYFAVQAAQTVEARAAQPGDLEASGDAFDPRTAPSVFRIGDSLVVSREVGLTLKVVELKEVVLSECHPA